MRTRIFLVGTLLSIALGVGVALLYSWSSSGTSIAGPVNPWVDVQSSSGRIGPQPTDTPTPTNTPTPTVIAADDFESDSFDGGTGWLGSWSTSGNIKIRQGDGPHSGSFHVRLRTNTGYAERSVGVSGQSGLYLEFWSRVRSFENLDTAAVLVSPDGSNWTVMKTFTSSDSDNAYHFYAIDLSGLGISSQVFIAFDAGMSSGADYWYVDDVEVVSNGPSPTATPTFTNTPTPMPTSTPSEGLTVAIEVRNSPEPGDRARFYVLVKDGSDNPVGGASVSLTLDTAGRDYSRNRTTNADGRASINIRTRSSDSLPWTITATASKDGAGGTTTVSYTGP